jgi:pimeloyl-ACP methyl ester carboxylesterase
MDEYSNDYIDVLGVKTAIFYRDDEKRKQVAVLVEMPGHGDSDIPSWRDLKSLRRWFSAATRQIAERFAGRKMVVFLHGLNGSAFGCKLFEKEVSEAIFPKLKIGDHMVVTHSFGCMAVDKKLATNAIFFTPVPSVSRFYQTSLELAERLFRSRLVIFLYRRPLAAFLRGMIISVRRDREGLKRIWDVGTYEKKMGRDKRMFQAKLASECIKSGAFDGISPVAVIFGAKDGMPLERSAEDLAKIFPSAKIASVEAGHLAPIEFPEEVAKVLKKALGTK